MRRYRFGTVLVGAAVFWFGSIATARTDIVQNWESPPGNSTIQGIQTFRGFAYSTNANVAISVKLMVIGITLEVPWGAARADVASNGGQLNSGFGITENMGNLPPGPVAITLEFREGGGAGACNAPACVQVTRNFTVVKPGARAGEVAEFRVLNDLFPQINPPANVSLDLQTLGIGSPDLIIAPAVAQDSGGAGQRTATVRMRWQQNTQSYAIIAAAPSSTEFAAVQAIFGAKCGIPTCHTGTDPINLPGVQDLTSANQSYLNTVGMPSIEDPDRLRVNPGNSANSYLYQKIIAGGDIVAGTGRMPLVGGPLSAQEIETIRAWIDNGAPPPAQ